MLAKTRKITNHIRHRLENCMKIFDLTNIKIEEKSFKNYDILDSYFDFKDNLRLLVLTVRVSSGKSNISSIEISNDFKNSKTSLFI